MEIDPQRYHSRRLPDEVVSQVFDHLSRRDLRAVRLQCRQFARVADELLFAEVYYSPGRPAMRALTEIYRHKYFRCKVKHLIFDDTQLMPEIASNFITFYTDLPRPAHAKTYQKWKAYVRYRRLFKEQNEILNSLEDLHTLTRALLRLPNLEKISVVGGMSRHPDSAAYFGEGLQAQRFADTLCGLSNWIYHHDQRKRYHSWDHRPFQHLIKAIVSSRIRLKTLHIGNWSDVVPEVPLKMGLPVHCLSLPTFDTYWGNTGIVARALSNITNLNLQIDCYVRPRGWTATFDDLTNLFTVLGSAVRLTRLSLGSSFSFYHINRPILANTWPALETFRLRGLAVDYHDLIRFLARHRGTLSSLTLDDAPLLGGPTYPMYPRPLSIQVRELRLLPAGGIHIYERQRGNGRAEKVYHNV